MKRNNNRFAEFLMNGNRSKFYDMDNEENRRDFVEFFLHPVTFTYNSDQQEMLGISSTMYLWEGGTITVCPIGSMQGYRKTNRQELYSPGDLVINDLYSDAFIYGPQVFTWCLPGTIRLLYNVDIRITARHITYDCRIRAYESGFEKLRYSWEKDPPEAEWFERFPTTLEDEDE